jgi:hypothetical protein
MDPIEFRALTRRLREEDRQDEPARPVTAVGSLLTRSYLSTIDRRFTRRRRR